VLLAPGRGTSAVAAGAAATAAGPGARAAVRIETPHYPAARVLPDSPDVIGPGETFKAEVTHANGARTQAGVLRWTDQRGTLHEQDLDLRTTP
jgi:hypothetical protein